MAFRYDTNVKTIMDRVTFRNYRWKGDGFTREAVWVTMTHSDKCVLRCNRSCSNALDCACSAVQTAVNCRLP